MPLPHATKSEPRSVKRFVLLKIVLCVLIFLLGVKTVLNLSRPDTSTAEPDTSTADLHQIDALAVEAYQKHLTAVNLELVKGTLHEASDPTRRCQSTLMAPIYFSGSATLNLKNGTKVELNITECHPCVWPVELGEDISAFANLVVTSDDNVSFSIDSFVGGTGESSSGTFSILLPTDLDQRICILQIIHQIAEYGAPPKREEFNRALKELLSPTSSPQVLRFASLLCRSVDMSLNIQ